MTICALKCPKNDETLFFIVLTCVLKLSSMFKPKEI